MELDQNPSFVKAVYSGRNSPDRGAECRREENSGGNSPDSGAECRREGHIAVGIAQIVGQSVGEGGK